MKKKFLLIMIILIFPLFINAQEVKYKDITITGNDSVEINKEIKLTFSITFDGLNNKSDDGFGIGGYSYQLDFDDNIFVPVKISDNDFFDLNIYKDENNRYFVAGTIKKDSKSKNKCMDNVLYCSNIKDTITFAVKDTSESKSVIKLYSSSAYLYKVGFLLDDSEMNIIDVIQNTTKTIKIKKSTSKSTKTNSVVKNIKDTTVEKYILNEAQDYKDTSKEESNNYLSNLTIVGYDISFDKRLLTYDINIPSNVNSLEIEAIAENKDASVSIKGNDDLKKNNYVIEIVVTSLDGSTKTYKINALLEDNREEDETIETTEDIKEFVNDVKTKINGKNLKTIEIVVLSLIGLIIIIVVIKIITNKKLNKKLKKFDDF